MKNLAIFLTIAMLLSLFPSGSFAQDKKDEKKKAEKQKEEKPPKDLIIRYDKFRDVSMVMTKPVDLAGMVGNRMYYSSMMLGAAFSGQKPSPDKLEIFLVFNPNATSFAASFSRGLSQSIGEDSLLHFGVKSEVIFLVDGERIKVPKAEKEIGYDIQGNWNDSAVTTVPLSLLEKLTTAKVWEVTIDSYECTIAQDRRGKVINPRIKLFVDYITKLVNEKGENQ